MFNLRNQRLNIGLRGTKPKFVFRLTALYQHVSYYLGKVTTGNGLACSMSREMVELRVEKALKVSSEHNI